MTEPEFKMLQETIERGHTVCPDVTNCDDCPISKYVHINGTTTGCNTNGYELAKKAIRELL